MNSNSFINDRPSKIFITLTPSILLNHPLTVLSHKVSVLRFQRSLCDAYSTSNGFLRELNTTPVGSLPVSYSLFFVKDLAVSIYKSEGILGFYRCLPEYIAYHLTKDLLKYLVPNYVLPIIPKFISPFSGNISLYSILDTNYRMKFRYKDFLLKNSDELTCNFIDYYKNKVQSELNKILTSLIVELITYPALTIMSRMIIYDGYGPVSFHLLFKHTYTVDGISSLYRGFIFHLLSNSVKYVMKHFNKFVQKSIASDYYVSPMFEQSLPVFLSISQTVLNQFSLIRRCGSKIDGFCVEENTYNIFKEMPWVSIMSQMFISIGLLQLKERLIANQIKELNTHFTE